MATLKTIAMTGPVTYPDGLAYAPAVKKIFVSDEHGGKDAVIDTANNKLVMNIPLGGGAGKRTTTTFGTMKSRSIISQEISCPSKR
jgi:hypothetical protein